MDDMMLERYTKRVGRLFRNYGPSVADVYGQANFSVMDMYSKYAKLDGGMAPQAYVTQPLWVRSNVFIVSSLVSFTLLESKSGTWFVCGKCLEMPKLPEHSLDTHEYSHHLHLKRSKFVLSKSRT